MNRDRVEGLVIAVLILGSCIVLIASCQMPLRPL